MEDLVKHEEKQLNRYMINVRETVMQAVYVGVKIKEADEGESRVDKWTGKVVHGQFVSQIEEVIGESWMWMNRGKLERETESLLAAAQDQAIRTDYRMEHHRCVKCARRRMRQ